MILAGLGIVPKPNRTRTKEPKPMLAMFSENDLANRLTFTKRRIKENRLAVQTLLYDYTFDGSIIDEYDLPENVQTELNRLNQIGFDLCETFQAIENQLAKYKSNPI